MHECVIKRIEIEFPWGCAALVGFKLFHGTHQIQPINPEAWIVSGGGLLMYDEPYWLRERPYILEAHCYNLDDTYDHTLQLRIVVGTPEEVFAPIHTVSLLDRINDMWRRVIYRKR